ncbi:unnamed protein product [Sphagnum jensenii]|uniref:Protein kinase domain-containing protein n=1 Tax=Sphagnum jensenii TaxID=128206 RepID=A0ABP0VPJ0_9BRYO
MDASCSSKYWECVVSELQEEEDPNLSELSQQTYYGSPPEYLMSDLAEPEQDPNLSELSQQTHYGSEPEYVWSDLEEPEEDPAARLLQETDEYEDQRRSDLLELTSIHPSQLRIVEFIGEGGQARVSLAKYTRRPGESKEEDVVVKTYKGRLGVDAVHELRRRIEHVEPGWCHEKGMYESWLNSEGCSC